MSDTDHVKPRAVERFLDFRPLQPAGKYLVSEAEPVLVVLASDYDALEDELQKQRELNMNAAISLVPGASEYERKLTALKAENERLKAANEKLHDALEAYLSEIQDERDDLAERYRKERNDPASVKAQGAIRQPKAEAHDGE